MGTNKGTRPEKCLNVSALANLHLVFGLLYDKRNDDLVCHLD
jgi:hypothetical protein